MTEKQKEVNIVSFSGGKDSTALLLMMLEKGIPIDEVIYLDTGVEFPEMYTHIEKVEQYTGIEITKLKSSRTFEYYLYEHVKQRGKYKGKQGYGFPKMRNRWCTSKLKVDIYNRYIKEKYSDCKINSYIGIAYDEKERKKEENYPLVDWEITEAMALDYCKSKGFDWGGLYEKFRRVSCWCCPMQRIDCLRTLYNDFPHLWDKLVEWENRLISVGNGNIIFWSNSTVSELTERFRKENERRNEK